MKVYKNETLTDPYEDVLEDVKRSIVFRHKAERVRRGTERLVVKGQALAQAYGMGHERLANLFRP